MAVRSKVRRTPLSTSSVTFSSLSSTTRPFASSAFRCPDRRRARYPGGMTDPIPAATLVVFRDRTDVVLVDDEVVDWSWGWIYKGDAPNMNLWRLRTRYHPVVKEIGNNVPANSPADVRVTIDGRIAPVTRVLGQSGEIDLDPDPVWNPATETYVYPPVPKADGTSVVTVSYRYSRLSLVTALDANSKVFYRLATVAVDPTGTSPSGLVETPLGYSEPLPALDSEKTDYIWTEAVRRNRWILEQGGERVKLFIRRVTGVPCPCQWDVAVFAFAKQAYNYCSCCYGTGFLGGCEGCGGVSS